MFRERFANAWAAFKLERERKKLEEEAEKRKKEAVKLGISNILIRIREGGGDLRPWVMEFERKSGESGETVITFAACAKGYRLSFRDSTMHYDSDRDSIPSRLTLSTAEYQILYEATISRITDYSGIGGAWYVASDNPYDILAFVPSTWTNDFTSIIEKADKRKVENESKQKHSPHALDDIKKRFGL
jgi:hypothetical protein